MNIGYPENNIQELETLTQTNRYHRPAQEDFLLTMLSCSSPSVTFFDTCSLFTGWGNYKQLTAKGPLNVQILSTLYGSGVSQLQHY